MTGAQLALASGALITLGLVLAVWRLVPAAPREGTWQGELDIRLYRARGGRPKAAAQRVWEDVQRLGGAPP